MRRFILLLTILSAYVATAMAQTTGEGGVAAGCDRAGGIHP